MRWGRSRCLVQPRQVEGHNHHEKKSQKGPKLCVFSVLPVRASQTLNKRHSRGWRLIEMTSWQYSMQFYQNKILRRLSTMPLQFFSDRLGP